MFSVHLIDGGTQSDALAGDAAVEDLQQLDARDVPVAENLRDRLTDGAEPQQADANRVNSQRHHTPYP